MRRRTVRGDLAPVPEICHEGPRIVAVAFADAIGNDRLRGRGESDENVLIAQVGAVRWGDSPTLLPT